MTVSHLRNAALAVLAMGSLAACGTTPGERGLSGGLLGAGGGAAIGAATGGNPLTGALIGIGKHFEMFTVAEAVETEAEANFLVGMGVDCLQGYLFGAPTIRPEWARNPVQQSA